MKIVLIIVLFVGSFIQVSSQETIRYSQNPTSSAVKPIKVTYKRVGYSPSKSTSQSTKKQYAQNKTNNKSDFPQPIEAKNGNINNSTTPVDRNKTQIAKTSLTPKYMHKGKSNRNVKYVYRKIGPSTLYSETLPEKK